MVGLYVDLVDLVRNHKTVYMWLEPCSQTDFNLRLKEGGGYFRSNVEPQTQQRLRFFLSSFSWTDTTKKPRNLLYSENYLACMFFFL